MQAKRIWAMYWSATGTTKTVVTAIATKMAGKLGLPLEEYDFTLPGARQGAPDFAPEDVVVFGTPTYAGRVPNVLLKYLATVKGSGAAAVPVVTFGNRAFDDSLIELRDILADKGSGRLPRRRLSASIRFPPRWPPDGRMRMIWRLRRSLPNRWRRVFPN